MIVTLRSDVSEQMRGEISAFLGTLGFSTTGVMTQSGSYLVCIGGREVDLRQVHRIQGVVDVHRVTDVYKLVSRKWKVEPARIDLGDGVRIEIGRAHV